MIMKITTVLIVSELFFLSVSTMSTIPCLVNLLNDSSDDPVECDFNFLGKSPYYDDDSFINLLEKEKSRLTILSMNCQSYNAKKDEFLLMLNQFNTTNSCGIGVICLQESWITADNDVFVNVPNYFSILKHCSALHTVDC